MRIRMRLQKEYYLTVKQIEDFKESRKRAIDFMIKSKPPKLHVGFPDGRFINCWPEGEEKEEIETENDDGIWVILRLEREKELEDVKAGYLNDYPVDDEELEYIQIFDFKYFHRYVFDYLVKTLESQLSMEFPCGQRIDVELTEEEETERRRESYAEYMQRKQKRKTLEN